MSDDAWDQNGLALGDGSYPTGAVAVTRAEDFVGFWRPIVVLDDEDEHEVGFVFYGRRRVFHLPAGVRSLSVGMDWCRSAPYQVEVRPGEVIELEASVRWRGFLWCLNQWASFLVPTRSFVLRPRAGQEARSRSQSYWEGVRACAGCVVLSGFLILLPFLVAWLLF
jgi:hypothetical protein